jgi:hypothetical protein
MLLDEPPSHTIAKFETLRVDAGKGFLDLRSSVKTELV